MPPATSLGFQAFILCGAGGSLNPFNTNPKDFPKALLPLANRPLLWYPLDWCYRMGVNHIYLVTPPESYTALDAALSQNPYLTALPSPKPNILAPAELELTSGTAELCRLPEVQSAITGDFIVLPCDLACELPGSALLETWMICQGGLGTPSRSFNTQSRPSRPVEEAQGRRGALLVYYDTKDVGEGGVGVKKEETDFISTTHTPEAVSASADSLRPRVRNLLLGMPTDALKDVFEDKKVLRTRRSLAKKFPFAEEFTKHRDAHIYFFPYWVKDWIQRQQKLESIGEDVIGWWAKASWQDGRLAEKLQMYEAMRDKRRKSQVESDKDVESINLDLLSSTMSCHIDRDVHRSGPSVPRFASRVGNSAPDTTKTTLTASNVPPLLAYIHPAITPSADPPALSTVPLIRRIDTVPLLLSASLYLARFPPLDEVPLGSKNGTSFSHLHKVHTTTIIPQRSTITQNNTLIDANVSIAEKTTIKESVVGNLCRIESMARLNRCLLMEGVSVGEKTVLNGCVVGRRAKIGAGCELRDCTIQEGYVVPEGTTSKGETFAGFDEGDGDLDGDLGDGGEDDALDL